MTPKRRLHQRSAIPENLPTSPFGTLLPGLAAMALYFLGSATKKDIRRISALTSEVREENRLPFFISGDGQPSSYTGWIDNYVLSRARHLVPPQADRAGGDDVLIQDTSEADQLDEAADGVDLAETHETIQPAQHRASADRYGQARSTRRTPIPA
jgi:hypothetical protein